MKILSYIREILIWLGVVMVLISIYVHISVYREKDENESIEKD